MGDRLTCVLPITPRLQHCSFLACWPLHKPFWGGKIHFSRSLEEQHCTHFTKFCLRSVRQSISCAPLSVASILWKLKINSTFWFPFYQPLYCTHAEAAGLLHSYIISVQAASQFLGCCLALHASYFFNLLKKPTSLQRSYRPGLIWNLPRVIVQLFPQMYNSKSFGKSKRESERESMTKESGDGKKRALRMTRSVPVIAVICNFLAACNTYKPWK